MSTFGWKCSEIFPSIVIFSTQKYLTPFARPAALHCGTSELRRTKRKDSRRLSLSLLSDVTTDGETAAGPIQENFKPDSLGSRGDLNKSDRIRHRHQILNWKFRNPYIFPSWAQQWNRIDCQNVCFLCNLYAYMCSTHKSLSQMVKKD